MSKLIKVGTMVLIIHGRNAGKTAIVIGHAAGAPIHTDHRLEFSEAVLAYVGLDLAPVRKAWALRSWIVPLTPPGEPEALIESSLVRDEVTV